MCGICGVVGDIDEPLLCRMTDTLTHRGPDGEGIYVADGIGLGMRRLSIIDISGGRQPISNESGDVWVIFNGEIYNYRELRRLLEQKGHRFATESDTEVIVHAYEEYGEACVHLFHGMFAFAIWDAKCQRFFAARDRFGKKPLYYWKGKNKLIFGSEIKAIIAHPEVPRAVDPDSLVAYLAFGYVPGPGSMFAGIRKVPPGHYLVVERGRIQLSRYWDLAFLEPQRRVVTAEAIEEIATRMDAAVRQRLIADVPLGVLLSGGIDSSTITALMARAMSTPVKTFTIGFDVGGWFSETGHARMLAEYYATDHHETIMQAVDVPKLLERVTWHFDEPVADPAALATLLICDFAKHHVTVLLTGEGGDEVFGGYPRYNWFRLATRLNALPAAVRSALIQAVESVPSGQRHHRWAQLLLEPLPNVDRHMNWVGIFTRQAREALGAPALQENGTEGTPETIITRYLDSAPGDSMVHRLMYLDVKTWLVDDVLAKVDRMSMAASLEARAPFLDHSLVEFVASLPDTLKASAYGSKPALRQMAMRLLPRETAHRPKHAFHVPVAHWIRGELRGYVSELLLSSDAACSRYFNRGHIEQLLRDHCEGRSNHERGLWTLLSFELWHRTFIDGRTA